MKKIYIALAVFAAATLSSCVREKSFENLTPLGENDIAFTIQNVSTKSADFHSNAVSGVSIPMGKTKSGEALFLEESIEQLNPGPATKGAPAYTINVGDLYPTMGVYAVGGNFGTGAVDFDVMDMYEHRGTPNDPTIASGKGWRYTHNYSGSPWPADPATKVDFYFNMPASPAGVSFSSRGDKKIEFSYDATTLATAEDQQDILFSQTSISKNEHDGFLPNGAPVLMYHALTGVKFRTGWANDNDTKTIITRVKIKGLKSKGTCTVDVAATDVVSWSVDSDTTHFSQAFKNQPWNEAGDGTVGIKDPDTGAISGWDEEFNGTSWVSAAADKNLNKADGSLTFWFIPQEIDDDVTLEVTFRVKTKDTPNGTEITHTIDFGQQLNNGRTQNVKWEAGQLRTYTLKPFDVDVEIEDKMTEVIKSDLHIANTGNVDEYVRVLIMGNWYGWKPGTTESQMQSTEPSILVGYKYQTQAQADAAHESFDTMVDPWYREGYPDPSNPGQYYDPYGYFDSSFTLAKLGARDGTRNDWADASGGFYYTMKIGPGEGTTDASSATKDLFKTYTVTNVPTIYLPSGNGRAPAEGVHLVMEIVVQAIAVPQNTDGSDKWWLQAWYEATGISKLDPDADRNSLYKTYYTNGEYSPSTSGE